MSIKPINILVFCGTALATSTVASIKLKEELGKRGIPCKINTGRISDMRSLVNLSNPDVVVATAITNMDVGKPVFNGVSLLTGINVEDLINDIVGYLYKENIISK